MRPPIRWCRYTARLSAGWSSWLGSITTSMLLILRHTGPPTTAATVSIKKITYMDELKQGGAGQINKLKKLPIVTVYCAEIKRRCAPVRPAGPADRCFQ